MLESIEKRYSKSIYKSLIKEIDNKPLDADYYSLKKYYVKSGLILQQAKISDLKKKLLDYDPKKDPREYLKIAKRILLINFCDVYTHIIISGFYQILNQKDLFEKHAIIAKGLLEALLETGDGESIETAFKVIDIEEEYAWYEIFYKPEGYTFIQRIILANKSGHTIDCWEINNHITNKHEYLYFNTAIPDAITWASHIGAEEDFVNLLNTMI